MINILAVYSIIHNFMQISPNNRITNFIKTDIMSERNLNKLMNALLIASSLAIFAGALAKIQHYPYGNLLLWYGFISQFVFSSIEISRQNQIIKKLKEGKIVE